MIIDLDSWEAGYGDGYAAARLNARPVSTGFSYSSGYVQARAVVQGRRRPLGCATFGHQSSEPLNGTVVAFG